MLIKPHEPWPSLTLIFLIENELAHRSREPRAPSDIIIMADVAEQSVRVITSDEKASPNVTTGRWPDAVQK